ncbi:MAG: barstar family protein [Kofleriaceae bacterium]
MAIFRDDANPWNQLDWRLLQHGPISLYSRPELLAEDVAWLAARHYAIDRLDCRDWTTSTEVYRALASAFTFPAYFGENLAALNDCLGTLSVPDEGGRVIVFDRFDVPARALTGLATGILDVIAVQARQHLLFGQRLIALVQSDDPKLAFDPIGATSVTWNPREWLAAARGS